MTYDISIANLNSLVVPLVRATEALVRLDERVARSPIRDGWLERVHFHDAAAAMWLEGELVHLEDLVLHDVHMDIRAPTHELTRAHAVLRARRHIFANPPDWALSRTGLLALRGRTTTVQEPAKETAEQASAGLDEPEDAGEGALQDALTEEMAAIDAVLERSQRVLDRIAAKPRTLQPEAEKSSLVYDLDWNEDQRLLEWQSVLDQSAALPPMLQAALAWDAWQDIEVLQHAPWLGPLLVAALLRRAGTTTTHLACFNVGLRKISRERRRAQDRNIRLSAFFEAVQETATAGLKDHDRLVLAREQMQRQLRQRRSNSKLPQLIDLLLARPLVFTTMIQKELKVTRQGALNLIGELNPREMTGRKRFQAWGIV